MQDRLKSSRQSDKSSNKAYDCMTLCKYDNNYYYCTLVAQPNLRVLELGLDPALSGKLIWKTDKARWGMAAFCKGNKTTPGKCEFLRLRRAITPFVAIVMTRRSSQTDVLHRVGIGVAAQDDGRRNLGMGLKESVWTLERNLLYRRIWSCFLLSGRPTCFAPLPLSLSYSLSPPSFALALPSRSFYRPRASRLSAPSPPLHFALNLSQCVSIRPRE